MAIPRKNPLWSRIALGAAGLWIACLFFHYFSWASISDFSFVSSLLSGLDQVQIPKLVDNWLSFLKTIGISFCVGLVIWRLGVRSARWIGVKPGNGVLVFCLEMALGILGLNALWLGLGFNGLWGAPLPGILAGALILLSLADSYRGFMKIQKLPRIRFPGNFYLLAGCLGGFCLLLACLQAMAPDIYFDGLVYHLSTLEFWKDHHGIADFYTNLYSYFPFGGELYFLNGYYFGGGEAAKMLNAFSAGLCALAAAGWVAEEAGMNPSILAWTMVLTLPLVSATVWTTQVDVLLAFFLLLFFYALWRWAEESSLPWALAAGLLGGVALSVKYTAVFGILSGIVALVLGSKKILQRKNRSGLILISAGAVLSVLPWLLRNDAYSGNGFYPYFSGFFGGRLFPVSHMAALLGDQEAVLNGNFSLGTWLAQWLSKDLDKTTAPLLFGFIPFLFLGKGRSPVTRFLLILAALWLPLGFLVSHQPRLMIPFFILALTAAGMTLGEFVQKGPGRIWGGTVLVFGLLSLFSLGRLSVGYYQTQKLWLGGETRQEYLTQAPQTASYYWLARAAESVLPRESRLLIVGDARGLYYSQPFMTNSVFDEGILSKLADKEKDGDGVWKRLHEMGMDALVLSGEEGKRLHGQGSFIFSRGEEEKLDSFIQRWTDPLVLKEGSGIYLLRSQPAIGRAPVPDLLRPFQAGSLILLSSFEELFSIIIKAGS